MLYQTIKDSDYELVFIMSFLESTIEPVTNLEIEKEIEDLVVNHAEIVDTIMVMM